jgi:hypothetical protein
MDWCVGGVGGYTFVCVRERVLPPYTILYTAPHLTSPPHQPRYLKILLYTKSIPRAQFPLAVAAAVDVIVISVIVVIIVIAAVVVIAAAAAAVVLVFLLLHFIYPLPYISPQNITIQNAVRTVRTS